MTNDASKRHLRGARAARHGPIQKAAPATQPSHSAHEHLTPLTASLELADVDSAGAAGSSAVACGTCSSALKEVRCWLEALHHVEAHVAPEFSTRYHYFSELFSEPNHNDRLARLARDDLLHHWGLCSLLLEESAKYRSTHANLSVEFAELAEAIAARLDQGFYGSAHVAAIQVRAAASLGLSFLALDGSDSAHPWLEEGLRRLRQAPSTVAEPPDLGTLSKRLAEIRDMRRRRSSGSPTDPKSGR